MTGMSAEAIRRAARLSPGRGSGDGASLACPRTAARPTKPPLTPSRSLARRTRRGRLRPARRPQDRLHHGGDAAVSEHRQSVRRRRLRVDRAASAWPVPACRLPARGRRVRDRGAPGPRSAGRRRTLERTSVARAIDACMAAIEVVDDRYEDYKSLDTPTLIADDFFNAGCVLGKPIESWDELDLTSLGGRMKSMAARSGPARAATSWVPAERARLARQRAGSAWPGSDGRRVRAARERGRDQIGRGGRSGRD